MNLVHILLVCHAVKANLQHCIALGDWFLVRETTSSTHWHYATDFCMGTEEY